MKWKLAGCATATDFLIWLVIYNWGDLSLDTVAWCIRVFAALHFPASILAALTISIAPAKDWVVFPDVACNVKCHLFWILGMMVAFAQTFLLFYWLGVYPSMKTLP